MCNHAKWRNDIKTRLCRHIDFDLVVCSYFNNLVIVWRGDEGWILILFKNTWLCIHIRGLTLILNYTLICGGQKADETRWNKFSRVLANIVPSEGEIWSCFGEVLVELLVFWQAVHFTRGWSSFLLTNDTHNKNKVPITRMVSTLQSGEGTLTFFSCLVNINMSIFMYGVAVWII